VSKDIGKDRVYIIGEIGINHNGSLANALRLIDVAKAAGCDAVKFQKRTVDVVYTPEELARPRESVFGKTNGDLKRGLEFGAIQYEAIARHCGSIGIDWGVSCWDEGALDFAVRMRPDFFKVASASITDIKLMDATNVASYKLDCPILISTGGSTMDEIHSCLGMMGENMKALLHCVSEYPCPVELCNLNTIRTLREEFREHILIGYSGHETGLAPTYAAVAMGARVIERHITLDRAMWGSDQSASVEPGGLAEMVRNIRAIEAAMGDGVKRITDGEAACMAKLRRVKS
jgi:N-acetylneuraminate synthase